MTEKQVIRLCPGDKIWFAAYTIKWGMSAPYVDRDTPPRSKTITNIDPPIDDFNGWCFHYSDGSTYPTIYSLCDKREEYGQYFPSYEDCVAWYNQRKISEKKRMIAKIEAL